LDDRNDHTDFDRIFHGYPNDLRSFITFFLDLLPFKMGKKNREDNIAKKSSSSIRQQDETFEYLTKTFNRKDGPIQVCTFI
jgi:hypothetical protein